GLSLSPCYGRPGMGTTVLNVRSISFRKIGLVSALILGLLTVLSLAASPEPQDQSSQFPTFAITNVAVFNGHTLYRGHTVLIVNGSIKAIGPNLKVANVRVIDATGDTLLPGLIDSHTHGRTKAELKEALVFGVTTELEMFNDDRFPAQTRVEQPRGNDVDVA